MDANRFAVVSGETVRQKFVWRVLALFLRLRRTQKV